MTYILIVDDEPHIRDLIAEILRDEGFDVATAMSGQQLLERVEISQPALVLLDVMMPGMSGIEALAALKARAHLANVPVVLMSAGIQYSQIEIATAGFLPKPFDLGELLSVVSRFVEAG
jgi:CheY-like chemotaxis protein